LGHLGRSRRLKQQCARGSECSGSSVAWMVKRQTLPLPRRPAKPSRGTRLDPVVKCMSAARLPASDASHYFLTRTDVT
jgi:hypothetical protein